MLRWTNNSKLNLKNTNKSKDLFLGKYNEDEILIQIKQLCNENEELRDFAREIKSELNYGRQRENKLMYFLFVLQQKGYPVFDVFEEDIRNIETYRFSKNLDEEYKKIYYEIRKRNFKKCKRKIDFVKSVEDIKIPKLSERNEEQSQSDLQSEFPLGFGLPPVAQKPEGVPNLNFKKIKNQNEDSITKGLLDKLKEKINPHYMEITILMIII